MMKEGMGRHDDLSMKHVEPGMTGFAWEAADGGAALISCHPATGTLRVPARGTSIGWTRRRRTRSCGDIIVTCGRQLWRPYGRVVIPHGAKSHSYQDHQ